MRSALLAALWLVVPLLSEAATAQPVPEDQGVVATGLLLRQMDGVKRVLMIAAHPDDEDTALLATLAREQGARTAYLSLSRGEGGQNLIGPELGEGLGIVRTGELLAARRLDGAEQHFTRAFDFGYSRNATETLSHWPEEELLDDVVRVVRRFRPQVIITVFEGGPGDGHGHHQVAGMMARLAFEAAPDPSRFPHHLDDGLAPWTPLKLYRSARRQAAEADLRVETGRLDPLLGRSPFQVAMESRSLHRSQDMGVARHPGPRTAPLIMVESRVDPGAEPAAGEPGLFTGIDTTLAGLVPPSRREISGHVAAYRSALATAVGSLHAFDPGGTAPALAEALASLRGAAEGAAQLEGLRGEELRGVLAERIGLAQRALLAAAGVVIEARTDRDRAVPGGGVHVEVRLWNGGPFAIEHAAPALEVPEGWEFAPAAPDAPSGEAPASFFGGVGGRLADGAVAVEPGELVRWRMRVEIPEEARPTTPYYLEQPLEGARYRWPDDPELHTLPHAPAPIHAGAELRLRTADGVPTEALRLGPAHHVEIDKAFGEIREPFLVVPRVAVSLEPAWMAWPLADRASRTVVARVRNEAPGGSRGEVRLEAPDGWRIEPAAAPFTLDEAGAEAELAFHLHPPTTASEGKTVVRAVAEDDEGRRFRDGFEVIDHPHIDRVAVRRPAELAISAFQVRIAEGLRVGYVMGSGDDGPRALRQLGADVELLGPDDLRDGDLDRFHTIVLGVRAYEVRPDLIASNERVLDFARRGGTVVVQYNKYEYPDGGFAPVAVTIDRPHDRITDPAAPVTLLDRDSPVLSGPNRIGLGDFEGWVQERGLYFLAGWDAPFRPLLEMADPGLEPVRGALVAGPVGEGVYVYTGLAFFRQLPEGVPGAFRLLANLVSLRGEEWRGYHAEEELDR